MLRKIAILFVLLSIPLCANASDGKGWYPFMQNKGWYPWQGQSGSSGSTETKEEPLVQPTTQNSSSNSTQPMTNTSSQSGNQQTQSNQTQSSWFNK